ncbi:hypothetical protein FHS85_001160 [Rhodoligotrophos appendicifer]|uniref:hypothetical protein n=1 Tax=Rhodoligotrophos appendicifer TaxID=987056 RepID=UPI00118586ED|nr:hypothetical protein [Rhodoligotrophos appendicifer]
MAILETQSLWLGSLSQQERNRLWERIAGEVPAMNPSAGDLLTLLQTLDGSLTAQPFISGTPPGGNLRPSPPKGAHAQRPPRGLARRRIAY